MTDYDVMQHFAYLHSINELDLSVRAHSALVNDRIETIEQLKAKPDWELLRLPNFGKVSLADVKEAIAKWDKENSFAPWVPVPLPPPTSKVDVAALHLLGEILSVQRQILYQVTKEANLVELISHLAKRVVTTRKEET